MHLAATRAVTPPAAPPARSSTTALLVALVLLAWLALIVWGTSPYARYLGHGQTRSGTAELAAGGLFLVGWALMIAAMMLPTVASLMRSFGQVVQARPDRRQLELMIVAGFVGAWLVVGSLFRFLDSAVHTAVAAAAWLDARPQLVGAAALVCAGVFQFTALKYRCLTACQSPRGFIYRYWRGGRATADALRIGAAYGLSCVGCCWALMLVLFALGSASLVWMFGLAAVIAAEKANATGRAVSHAVGAALILAGLAVATT